MILRDRRFSRLDREALRAAAEYGWSRGLAVPVARGGERFGLVTMIGGGDVHDDGGARVAVVGVAGQRLGVRR